jgi:hypothetical protein
MTPETTERVSDRRLAASRATWACGEEGLATAFRRACDAGLIADYDDLDDYLEAVLEGNEDDVLDQMGWRACAWSRRCRRAGRCLRHRR